MFSLIEETFHPSNDVGTLVVGEVERRGVRMHCRRGGGRGRVKTHGWGGWGSVVKGGVTRCPVLLQGEKGQSSHVLHGTPLTVVPTNGDEKFFDRLKYCKLKDVTISFHRSLP